MVDQLKHCIWVWNFGLLVLNRMQDWWLYIFLKCTFFNINLLLLRQKKAITNINLFVALIYREFWNEASMVEQAPLNGTKPLGRVEEYPNSIIADVAAKAFHCHLWYFSESLTCLAFFDPLSISIQKRLWLRI